MLQGALSLGLFVACLPALAQDPAVIAPRFPERSPDTAGLVRYQPSRSTYQPDDPRTGFFDLRFFLDGEATFYVQGESVSAEVRSGAEPVDAGSAYTSGLPEGQFADFTLEQRDGRGAVELIEAPSANNGYTAKLRMRDPETGDDRYHARLSWTIRPETSGPITAPEFPLPSGRGAREPGPRLPGEVVPPAADRSTSYQPSSRGEFEFRGVVDGRAILRIRGDRVSAETASGRPVETQNYIFSQPLPEDRPRGMATEQLDGRGTVELIVIPVASNGYTAAIEIDDPEAGDDEYHFIVRWQY